MDKEKRRKIVVACDSFKGSLSSLEAGWAAARGVAMADGRADVRVVAVADGGEGTVEAVRAVPAVSSTLPPLASSSVIT